MYKLHLTDFFKNRRDKLIAKDKQVAKSLRKALYLLSQNPKYPSLKSHQVISRLYGKCWSSNVTGDIRIIWMFHHEVLLVLILLDIGGHSGKGKVYK